MSQTIAAKIQDPMETWLKTVELTRSGSDSTQRNYRKGFQEFLDFIRVSAGQIVKEYEESNNEMKVRSKYSLLIQDWMIHLYGQGFSSNTVASKVGAVQSFFRYRYLTLGKIPMRGPENLCHNRDITKEEIALILHASKPKLRAFFCLMSQSGLRPFTICRLQIKDLELPFNRTSGLIDWEKVHVPMKIQVSKEKAKGKYGGYFSFVGEETVKYLKDYSVSRVDMLTPNSFVFVKDGPSLEPTKPKTVSSEFNRLVRKLLKNKELDFELAGKKGKPAELRLYNLRKFFKKYSQQAGEEYNEFWMGHKGGKVLEAYRTVDPEFHRTLYKEKAMPFLRIEERTPTEQDSEIQELRRQLRDAQKLLYQLATAKFRASRPEGTQEDVDEYVRLLDNIAKNAYPDTYETLEERETRYDREWAEKETKRKQTDRKP